MMRVCVCVDSDKDLFIENGSAIKHCAKARPLCTERNIGIRIETSLPAISRCLSGQVSLELLNESRLLLTLLGVKSLRF